MQNQSTNRLMTLLVILFGVSLIGTAIVFWILDRQPTNREMLVGVAFTAILSAAISDIVT